MSNLTGDNARAFANRVRDKHQRAFDGADKYFKAHGSRLAADPNVVIINHGKHTVEYGMQGTSACSTGWYQGIFYGENHETGTFGLWVVELDVSDPKLPVVLFAGRVLDGDQAHALDDAGANPCYPAYCGDTISNDKYWGLLQNMVSSVIDGVGGWLSEAQSTHWAQCMEVATAAAVVACLDKLPNPIVYSLCVATGISVASYACRDW